MRKSLLITRPFYDEATSYLYHWCKGIIKFAKMRNIPTIDLEGKKANKRELESRLKKIKPEIVMLNGHGSEDSVLGQGGEAIVIRGDNESILSGKIVYVRSCKCASGLGKSCIKNNISAFIGYQEDFIFVYDDSKVTRPLQDETAKLFLEPSNQVVISLLKGNSANESHQKAINAYLRNIRKLSTSEVSHEDATLIRYLIWDMYNQVCLEKKPKIKRASS